MQEKDKGLMIIIYIILILLAIFALAPLLLMVINSFKTRMEITMNPIGWPEVFRWGNYVEAWQDAALGTALANSMFISGLTIIITCFVAGMAAYILSRKAVRGWGIVTLYFLACTTIPIQLFIIPLFFIFQKLGLVNSRLALCFIYTALYTPFSMFLLRAYFVRVGTEVIESARVDGATEWQIFTRIMLPLVSPGLLTVALVVGLWTWNEFLLAVTFLKEPATYTMAIRFYSFSGRYITEWGKMMAAAVIISIPMILLFIMLQRRFIEGMTSGGVKG
ncbi:MAG: carbohydrate ABC transporter permease [Bacillota bacterium]